MDTTKKISFDRASISNMNLVYIDVYGERMTVEEVVCDVGNRTFLYVIDESLKPGQKFNLGLFFSKSVLSDDVFQYPRSQRIGVLTESPIDACYRDIPELIRRFPLIFTHQEELLNKGGPFSKLMFGTNWVSVINAQDTLSIQASHPSKCQLVSFMGSIAHAEIGAYRFRKEVATYLQQRKDVMCFGKGICEISDKRDAIAPYYFSISMENTVSNYYFSEKLVDCLLLETVPIYFGCPGISELFDTRGFLIFKTQEELASILDRLTPELYSQMRPYVLKNKQKVIAERWHSHAGLFARMSDDIPLEMLSKSPVRYRNTPRLDQVLRKRICRLIKT